MTTPKEYFGISCPEGGDFYVCTGLATEFVGCCTSNACTNRGVCPAANLRVMTFQQNKYELLPPLECSNAANATKETQGLWYSCKFTVPPFLGCCSSNPCSGGSCPREDLVPGKLPTLEQQRNSFLTPQPTSSGTSTGSATAAATTTTGASGSATGTSAPANQGSKDGGLSTGAIVGIAVGGVVVALVCLGILMYRCGWAAARRKNRRSAHSAANMADHEQQRPLDGFSPQMSPYQDSFGGQTFYQPGTHDGYAKHQSPQMSQYSPNTMAADSPHHRFPSGGNMAAFAQPGRYHQERPLMEPQELDAMDNTQMPELASDGDGRLYHPYADPSMAGAAASPAASPRHSRQQSMSPGPSPLVGTGDRQRRSRQ